MNKKNVADIYPLSPTQQGILFQTLAVPGTGIHHEQLVCQLQGEVDREAFARAWQAVLERHEVLRTGFVWKNAAEPLQVVFKQVDLPLEWDDWQVRPSEEQAAGLQAFLAEDRRRGFDLARPPLMRLALFQLGPQRYQLVWSHNHILMDGWCGPLLLHEFLAFYQSFRAGRFLELPPSRPYKDYIRWLKAQDPEQAETFWRERLSGLAGPTPPGVPAGPRPLEEQVERYGEQRDALPETATARLRSLAQARRLTLNTLAQGAWALVLARYSGGEDVVFGATVSGRPPGLAGVETAIGLFINTLPVRMKVDRAAGLWDWLGDLQAANFEMGPYEATPGPLVHRWSGLPGSLPLYDSLLVFENYPLEAPELGAAGLSIDLATARSEGARTGFPLTILVMDGDRLQFQLVHDCRRIDEAGSDRILAHFLAILEAMAAGGEDTLADYLERIPEGEIPCFHALPARQSAEAGYVAPRTETEARLATLWSEILGVERVGVLDNFFELGGHSLLAIQLYYQVRAAYPVDLPLLSLFEEPNVARLAQAIEAALRGESGSLGAPSIDLAAEVALDPEIDPQGRVYEAGGEPDRIFLTGATGFLGAYLLYELLTQTQAGIACLVRAPDQAGGLRRLQRALESHNLWDPAFEARLDPVVGDLAQPLFGLPPAAFQALAESVDAIYHNGAWVTYVFPYPALKAANVLGTQEALRLACRGRLKPVHYVSSLAVFPLAIGRAPFPVQESDEPEDWRSLFGGYAQSKWVAEKLVAAARERGLPVTIYRPGLVTGHSQTGAGDSSNMMSLMVKGCLQLGSLPDLSTRVDMTPVDFVSQALVYLSRQPEVSGRVYHLVNPRPARWDSLSGWLAASGFPLRTLPYEEWQEQLAGPAGHRTDNALYPLLPLLSERAPNGQPLLADTQMPEYHCQATLAQLAGSGLECPPVDANLVRTYLGYFEKTGFLETSPANLAVESET